MYDRRAAPERRAGATFVFAHGVRAGQKVRAALHGVRVRWVIVGRGARLEYEDT
jgi:hypothetical protein